MGTAVAQASFDDEGSTAVRAPDDGAYAAFVAERSDDLLRTAVLLTRDRDDAEDLLQSALATAWRRWPRIAGEDPSPAVRKILVRTAAGRRRGRAVQDVVTPAIAEPVDSDDARERERTAEALDRLPPLMRTVLGLRYAEELGEAATAELLGVPVSTVQDQTTRGLARLAAVLGAAASGGSTERFPLDADLERRLRDQRVRAEAITPPPSDLPERARAEYRALRRRRLTTAAGALALIAFLAGLRFLGPAPADEPSPDAAPPTATRLYDVPPRGSLARDADWLAAVLALDWTPGGPGAAQGPLWPDGVLDPPGATRRVAFTADLPGARLALVLGRDDDHDVHAWFVGPEGASPAQMTPAYGPDVVPSNQLLTLGELADGTGDDGTGDDGMLVVVGLPGDGAQLLPGRTVTASGETQEVWRPLGMADGTGVVPEAAGPPELLGGTQVRVVRAGRLQEPVFVRYSDRARAAAQRPVEVLDPRGLRGRAEEEQLQAAVHCLTGEYGLGPEELRPTLLAAGPLREDRGGGAVLVGATLPSGATTACLQTYQVTTPPDSWTGTTILLDPEPAGTALLERVIAVPTSGVLAVSGPREGVVAEALLDDGSVLGTVPLTAGAGVGPLPPPAAHRVRIRDAAGAVVAEAALSGPDG